VITEQVTPGISAACGQNQAVDMRKWSHLEELPQILGRLSHEDQEDLGFTPGAVCTCHYSGKHFPVECSVHPKASN